MADGLILGIIALSALIGLWRGLIKEVFSILVWVAAGWVAFRYADPVTSVVPQAVELPSARALIAFIGLFLVVLVIGGLATWAVGRIVRATGLSGTDRMLGLVFGAVRGVFIIVLAVLIAGFSTLPEDPWWQRSRLIPHFEAAAEAAMQ